MKFKYVFVSLLFLSLFEVSQQAHAQVTINKRGSGSIGDAPQPSNFLNGASLDAVDYSSGTLKVGIPLYEIKLKDITVPISINYSALGIKVGQRPSCVGMGWELNAGGKITQIVNGYPDDDPKGLKSNSNPMSTLDWEQNQQLQVATNTTHRDFVGKVIDSKIDGAWDAFAYTLPTKGGKYMECPNGVFLTFPYDALLRRVAGGLATGDGLTYTFARGTQKHTQKRSFYDKTYFRYDETWTSDMVDVYDEDLKTITSARHNETVTFDYESTDQTVPHPTLTTTVAVPVVRDIDKNQYPYAALPQFHVKEPTINQTMVTTVVSSRITGINFPGGKVVFSYLPDQNEEDVLGTITIQQVKDGVYSTLKSFEFGYDGAPAHYLTSVVELDANGFSVNTWSFNYNGYMPVSTIATGYNQNSGTESYAQDRWGFYNGKTDNKTLIENPETMLCLLTKDHYPIYNIGSEESVSSYIPVTSREAITIFNPNPPGKFNYANRECDTSLMKKGLLTGIVTPTGDVITYEYEPHQFNINKVMGGSIDPTLKYGGGVRIKAITHKSQSGKTLLKKIYKYGMGDSYASSYVESGFGKVNFPATVLSSNTSYEIQGSSYSLNVQDLLLLSHAANDMAYSSGSYAAYGSTTEYLVKDTSALDKTPNIMKTVYIFKSPDIDPVHFNDGTKAQMVIPTSYPNSGVKNDNLDDKPAIVTKFRTRRSTYDGSIFYDKSEETTTAYRNYQVRQPDNPSVTNSYLGGIKKIRHQYYDSNSMFQYCTYTSTVDPRNGITSWALIGCQPAPASPVDVYFFNSLEEETANSYYDGKYDGIVTPMYKFSDIFRVDSVVHQVYGTTSQPMQFSTTSYNYTYTCQLPNYIYTRDNIGKSILTKRITYPLDYSSVTTGGIPALINNNIFTDPIEQFSTVEYVVGGWGPTYVTSGVHNTYTIDANSFVHNSVSYQLNTQGKPLLISNYSGINDARYEAVQQAEAFDAAGNMTQSSVPGGAKTVTLWAYNSMYPVANVTNAVLDDVAYSGFEAVETGNWTYNTANRVTTGSPIGKAAYNLSAGAITKSSLTAATHYTMAYWLKSGAAITVTGGTVSAAIAKKSYNGWTYYERDVTGTTSLNITGTGYLDELRLHPFDALMNTYTYDSLIGMTSATDAKGQTVYYEYDASQRLSQVKDQDGNIVKKVNYHFYNQ